MASHDTVDDYIATFPPEVQSILGRIRAAVRRAAPGAEERLSYGMPAYFFDEPIPYALIARIVRARVKAKK